MSASITSNPAVTSPVNLAPPGAGLPFPESLIVRLFGKAFMLRKYNWEGAIDCVEQTATALVERVESLDDETASRQVLIPRQRGLEDSSRFWSPLMVIEHLNLTGRGFEACLLALTKGNRIDRKVSTAAVKPTGAVDRTKLMADFKRIHLGLRKLLEREAGPHRDSPRHTHPWFGALNPRQWLNLMATHMQLHARQLEMILGGNS